MIVSIKFLRTGSNSALGSFSFGDTARVHIDLANHFVDLGLAEYSELVNSRYEQHNQDQPETKTNKRKPRKASSE